MGFVVKKRCLASQGFVGVLFFLMLCKNFCWCCLCVWKMFLLDMHVLFCCVDFLWQTKLILFMQ